MMIDRNWSPIIKLSSTPEATVEHTSEAVPLMPFSIICVMLLNIPLATMHEPKHMAQRMSHTVLSMPTIPRVATKELIASNPVSIFVFV